MGGGADVLNISGYVYYSQIEAGAGTDNVFIGENVYSSTIQLGGNSDTLVISGELEYVTINGGAGGDLITVSAYNSAQIHGDGGSDTINVNGEYGTETKVFGGDGADSINFSAGWNTYEYYSTIEGGLGADTINFGPDVAQYVAFNSVNESNVNSYDKVSIGASAGLVFKNLTVTGVFNYGTDDTPFKTNNEGYATFKDGNGSLNSRLTILDNNLDRGDAVLFDAVDANGDLKRFVFVQAGATSGGGLNDDYLVQVDNVGAMYSNGDNNLYIETAF